MRILVTGSSGFVGTHLCTVLEPSRHDFFGFDRQTGLTIPDHLEETLFDYEPDLVIHLAAKVGREFGEDDVNETVAQNAGNTAYVAKLCGEIGIRLAYTSTSEVYGDNGENACDELTGPFALPHNTYGLSKKWGEDACRLYAPEGLLIWRLSMPYGPGLPPGRGRAAMVNFLYNALHGRPILVHKNSERSWCWIGDTVHAMLLTLTTDGGTFNIGRDDNAHSMLAIAEMACWLTGASDSLIEEIDPPERQTVVKRLSTEKIRSLGWKPEMSLQDGMVNTLAWVKTCAPPEAASTLSV